MNKIIAYLFALVGIGVGCGIYLLLHPITETHPEVFLVSVSLLAGLFGGLINCLRAVYLNACVYKRWDPVWHPWYIIRPVLSTLMGGISYVFIRAGLIVFGQGHSQLKQWSVYGYLAACFIAGYNVERFLERIEAISEASFGVKKRANRDAEETKK